MEAREKLDHLMAGNGYIILARKRLLQSQTARGRRNILKKIKRKIKKKNKEDSSIRRRRKKKKKVKTKNRGSRSVYDIFN